MKRRIIASFTLAFTLWFCQAAFAAVPHQATAVAPAPTIEQL